MVIEILLMFLGQIAAAISIFFIRSSELAPGMLAAYRLFFTSLILLPWHLRDRRQVMRETGLSPVRMVRHLLRHSLVPGVILGFHFIFWNTGARMTIAANATLFVNMTPVAMPLVIFFLTKEKPSWKELAATAVAISGALLLTVGDLNISRDHLLGDLYAFISMIFLTVYLALSRRHRALPFWYYIWGVYLIGAFTAFAADLLRGAPLWSSRGTADLIPVAGLALVSTIVGHNLINRAMRTIPSQIVGVGQLSQFLWAGILAWLIYGELPAAIFYPSMGLIALGTTIMIVIHRTTHDPRGEEAYGSDLS
jgi:drug/metabolite transporter (DMT)-like permease